MTKVARGLKDRGLRVWYDDSVLKIGDSLGKSIDKGLMNSKYGLVIFSPDFFRKGFAQWELDGLVTREVTGEKVILPVWHNVKYEDVKACSPSLADKYALRSSAGLDKIIDKIMELFEQFDCTITFRNGSVPSLVSIDPVGDFEVVEGDLQIIDP